MVPEGERGRLCLLIMDGSLLAAAHVRRTGRIHRNWGNGSLMAAARRFPLADEPDFSDPEYCRCTIQVLEAIARLTRGRS